MLETSNARERNRYRWWWKVDLLFAEERGRHPQSERACRRAPFPLWSTVYRRGWSATPGCGAGQPRTWKSKLSIQQLEGIRDAPVHVR